jgi:SRSO17 transposase
MLLIQHYRQYDIQAQKGLPALAAQAIGAGAYGGGREGVQRAEYQTQSDLNRALLQAQLQQQGYSQAQNLAANQYTSTIRIRTSTTKFIRITNFWSYCIRSTATSSKTS